MVACQTYPPSVVWPSHSIRYHCLSMASLTWALQATRSTRGLSLLQVASTSGRPPLPRRIRQSELTSQSQSAPRMSSATMCTTFGSLAHRPPPYPPSSSSTRTTQRKARPSAPEMRTSWRRCSSGCRPSRATRYSKPRDDSSSIIAPLSSQLGRTVSVPQSVLSI